MNILHHHCSSIEILWKVSKIAKGKTRNKHKQKFRRKKIPGSPFTAAMLSGYIVAVNVAWIVIDQFSSQLISVKFSRAPFFSIPHLLPCQEEYRKENSATGGFPSVFLLLLSHSLLFFFCLRPPHGCINNSFSSLPACSLVRSSSPPRRVVRSSYGGWSLNPSVSITAFTVGPL